MKKVSLLLLLALASFSVSAQSDKPGRSATFETNGFWDNWFVGAGARGTVYFGDRDNKADFLNRPTLNGSVFVGKWFSPNFGIRLAADGGGIHKFRKSATSPGASMSSMDYINGHVDAMFNVTNYLCKYKENRFYHFIPYVGLGYAKGFRNDWKSWENNSISFNAGLLNTFRLSNKFSAYVELAGAIVDDEFDGVVGGDWNWDGLGSATVGFVYNFGGKTTFQEATLADQGLIDDLNSRVNRLKAENDQLRKRPEYCPECPKVQPQQVVESAGTFVPSVVFFRLNSANIDNNQVINIYNTAEYLKANPSAKVKVVGYADKKTGTASYNDKLSEKRAKAVANTLIKKYNISSDRVAVEWKGSSEQPYAENAWNRVAIFFAD